MKWNCLDNIDCSLSELKDKNCFQEYDRKLNKGIFKFRIQY